MSEKNQKPVCPNHAHRHRRLRRFCAGLLIFNFILLLIILLIWAILQPTKPRFVLQDATLYALNVSGPSLLTSNFQITIQSRNPNDHLGIYYDKLIVYATYRNQQITYATAIPPVYQGHKDVNIWSPFIYGTAVPVAPYIGSQLTQDQSVGQVLVVIKIDGRVRWKVGTFISSRYHLHVRCRAPIIVGNPNTGVMVGTGVKYQLFQRCGVSV